MICSKNVGILLLISQFRVCLTGANFGACFSLPHVCFNAKASGRECGSWQKQRQDWKFRDFLIVEGPDNTTWTSLYDIPNASQSTIWALDSINGQWFGNGNSLRITNLHTTNSSIGIYQLSRSNNKGAFWLERCCNVFFRWLTVLWWCFWHCLGLLEDLCTLNLCRLSVHFRSAPWFFPWALSRIRYWFNTHHINSLK